MTFGVEDGVLTYSPEHDRLVRVFLPRWWQLWRWVAWLRSPRLTAVVVFAVPTDPAVLGRRRVRVLPAPARLAPGAALRSDR